MILQPRIIYDETGDVEKAKTLKGKALQLYAHAVGEPLSKDLGSYTRFYKTDNNKVRIRVDVFNDAYMNRTGVVTVWVAIEGGFKKIQCSFIYWPRNSFGNYFNSPLHGFYPSINQLVHNATKNKVSIVEDLDAYQMESNKVWTNHKDKFVLANRRNGAFFGITGTYSFENNNHFFTVRQVSVTGLDYVNVYVYDFSETLLQTFTVPNLLSIRHVMANKSANEFVIIGDLQDYTYKTDKALPFDFDPADYGGGATATNYKKRLQIKWEGITRYAITETGVPATPYSFDLVSYTEQWRGCAMLYDISTVETGTFYFHGETWNVTVDSSGTYTQTTTGTLGNAVPTVLYAYYSGDDYKTIEFNPGSFTYSSTAALTSEVGGGAVWRRYTENVSISNTWAYTLDGNAGNFAYSRDTAIDIKQNIGGAFITNTGSNTESFADMVIPFLWGGVFNFPYYSKVIPRWTMIAPSGTITYSGVAVNTFFYENPLAVQYLSFNTRYFSRSVSGIAGYPAKVDSLYSATDSIANSLRRAINVITAPIGHNVEGMSKPDGSGYIITIDALYFNSAPSAASIYTDIHNSHLVAWQDVTDYEPYFDPCKAYITNKDLSLKVDLATVIPYPFFEQDFRGAYYVTSP